MCFAVDKPITRSRSTPIRGFDKPRHRSPAEPKRKHSAKLCVSNFCQARNVQSSRARALRFATKNVRCRGIVLLTLPETRTGILYLHTKDFVWDDGAKAEPCLVFISVRLRASADFHGTGSP